MITLTVCIGSSCHLKGSYDILTELQKLVKENNLENKIDIKASFCLGDCKNGVCVKVDDSPTISVNKDNFESFFSEYIINKL